MTGALVLTAYVATMLDALAYLVLVLPGLRAESNPVVVMTGPIVALILRGLALVAITAFAIAFNESKPYLVRGVLVVAVAVGLLGFASTVA